MNKKITAAAMLMIFMFVSFSCNPYYAKKIQMQEWNHQELEDAKVLTVYTKSRQIIMFLKKKPAVVSSGNIVGFTEDNAGQKKLVSIPLAEAKVIWLKKWNAATFIDIFAPIGALLLYSVIKYGN